MNNACFVVQPILKDSDFDYSYKIEEACNLAKALDLDVLHAQFANIREINPATFISKGLLEEIKAKCDLLSISTLIVNGILSAIQQRNLEKFLNVKVLDRNGLILNIFSSRARSKEGKLQTQLASLMYQKSRLVKAWGHLERQRGGGGFIGGPGETQKELDKRMIADQIEALKAQLKKAKLNRDVQGVKRKKNNYKSVVLVGYTNSGKSTLFNALADADVLAKDMLFATLDTTLRTLSITSKYQVILSDTVGFVSDLPHQLITAFHSTLAEALDADLILHVIDGSNPHYKSQIQDVKSVLEELGINDKAYKDKVIEVYNKIDMITNLNTFKDGLNSEVDFCLVSAKEKLNLEEIKNRIFNKTTNDMIEQSLTLHYSQNDLLLFLYNNAIVIDKYEDKNNPESIQVKFKITPKNLEVLNSRILNSSRVIVE